MMCNIDPQTGEVIVASQDELFAALANAQSEFEPVSTDKEVKFQTRSGTVSYKYASFGKLTKQCGKILSKNGLSICQIIRDNKLITMLGHKSGQCISSEMELPQTTDMKQMGANLTYLRRYQYTAIAGIAVWDEDDENVIDNATEEQRQTNDLPQPSQPQNGHPKAKKERPLSPEDVKMALKMKADKFPNKANEGQMNYARNSLSTLCDKNDTVRHAVGNYLFGKSSSKEWTSGECSAVIEWAGANKVNDYTPNEFAFLEAEQIIEHLVKEGAIVEKTIDLNAEILF